MQERKKYHIFCDESGIVKESFMVMGGIIFPSFLYTKLNQEIFENLSDDFKEKFLKKSVKIATKITKAKSISKIKEHEKCFKKDYLRRKNQGNQLS
jgi:hypothetical protein